MPVRSQKLPGVIESGGWDSRRQAWHGGVAGCYKSSFVLDLILAFLAAIRVLFRGRVPTFLEVLALRQQLAVLKRKRPRLALNSLDRLFWTSLQRVWPRWSDVLLVVKPETVVGWHRAPVLTLAISTPRRPAQNR
jgi:hypothetical protein